MQLIVAVASGLGVEDYKVPRYLALTFKLMVASTVGLYNRYSFCAISSLAFFLIETICSKKALFSEWNGGCQTKVPTELQG
jgi:hypothetical protein